MGKVFAGAFAYADYIILLSPSVQALNTLLFICNDYASRYDVKFNALKSNLIVFRSDLNTPPDPSIEINGVKIKMVGKVIFLGHLLTDCVYDCDTSKCTQEYNRQCNMLLADFKSAGSYMRNYLFSKYCTSFYGSNVLPLYDDSMENLCKSWRIAIRRVWRIPWRTHCIMLPYIAEVVDPKLMFDKRCIKFINNATNSCNTIVNTISNMGLYSSYSIMGTNARHLDVLYNMKVSNVHKTWTNRDVVSSDTIRLCTQVKELIDIRDSCTTEHLNYFECKTMIDYLCTY